MLRAVCLVALVAAARAHAPVTVSAFNDNNTITNGSATKGADAERLPVHQRLPHAVLFGGTCGGSIIHPRWILTAAHCTLFTGGRSVLAGTSVSDDGSGWTVRVKKLHIHPLFSVGPYWVNARRFGIKQNLTLNWVGLLTSNRIQWGERKLPNGNAIRRHLELGSNAVRKAQGLNRFNPTWGVGEREKIGHDIVINVAARWDFMLAELAEPLPLDGLNMAAVPLDREPDVPELLPVSYGGYGADHHGGMMKHQMHAMKLQTVSDERCAALEQYNKQDMGCAEGRTAQGDSACNGDSGSGVVSEDGPRRLVGVTSWVQDDAHECGPGKLVVYSRVAAAVPWIMNLTAIAR